jgi:SAM-dependent methyltransferase
VVGVDFSSVAITEAERLARVTRTAARFVHSDIYELAGTPLGKFDVVYTSLGVLWWLPDLWGWARIIADHLDAAGFFYIHEIHPTAMMLTDTEGGLTVGHDYFGSPTPDVFEGTTGTYYDAPGFSAEPGTECGWTHSLGDLVTALTEAGLHIDYLHEQPSTGFRMMPSLERDADGSWTTHARMPRVPLTFSLRASA